MHFYSIFKIIDETRENCTHARKVFQDGQDVWYVYNLAKIYKVINEGFEIEKYWDEEKNIIGHINQSLSK